MSTCFWCTSGANSTADFLKLYASSTKPSEFQRVSDDLCYCLECVAIYHKARDEVPFLHEALWELETSRLISHFESTMQAEIKEESDLYIVENAVELPLFDLTYQDIENKLRVPLLEILKYPYLLLHERVSELCVEALCRLEQASCSFQVFEKYPGVYLFLVHPNEMVRRWAILTAKSLGKVDRDDYYDLQEVLTCLFKVMKLGLLESPDIYNSSVLEKGKLILLPAHMYDTMNYKTYWLGICMLLTILEEQAMDSLLLGSGKENDFMQSILHTMKKQSDGNFSVDINPFVGDAKINDSGDPFWPALHCFMVILDRLGSKVWGQRVDPIEAFQTIIDNNSYNREIQNIRKSSVRTKVEPESCLDDMVTCSQIVYSYNPEKNKKDSGWRSAICPDYCPNMYEEMETLTSVLQSDIGQDMRVHNSTFLWFIPFVQSLMDLQDLGVAYIAEVIHHLYSKVKDVLNQTVVVCDKVTEFFLLILVSVIELHRNRKCLHFLWASSQSWVEAVVKCAKLPTSAFAWSSEKSCSSGSKGTLVVPSVSLHSMPSNSVQHACVQLIRSLLKEGYQLGQPTPCKRFWDKLNLFLRGNLSLGWQLTSQETQELQTCLKQIIKNIKAPQCNTFVDPTLCKPSPACYYKEEREKEEKCKNRHCLPSPNPAFSKEPKKADVQGSVSSKARSTVKEGNEQNSVSDSKLEDHLSPELCFKQSSKNLFNEGPQDQVTSCSGKQKCVNDNLSSALQSCTSRNSSERECDRGIGGMVSPCLLTDLSTDSLEKVSTSNEDFSLNNDILGKTSKARSKAQKDEICAKLSRVIKKQHSKSTSADNIVKSEGNLTASDVKNLYSRKATGDQKGEAFLHSLSVDSNSILDNKNGEQKSDNRSLLTKKQLKNEELDVFSAHENDCHIQECHTVTDVASFTDVTNTCMHKTSPFRDPVSGLESRTKEVAKRIRWLSLNLRVENLREVSPKSDPLKDSQIDTDLNKLPLVAQGSTSTFPSESAQNTSQLQRKVKDKRSLTANRNNAGETHCGQIIVISDSDDDDDDERVLHFEKHIIKQDKICIEKEGPQHHVSVGRRLMEKEKANSPLLIEEDDSQVFEFESQKNVFSVWQEQKPDSKNSVQGDEETACLTDMADITNDWGYDTDYPISEEVSAKGAEDIEERARPQNRRVSAERVGGTEVKKPKRKQSEKPKAEAFPSRPSTSDRDEDQSDIFNESELTGNDFKVIDLTTTAAGSGIPRTSTVPLKKSSPKLHTYSKTIRRVSASKTPKKTQSDTKIRRDRKASYLSCRTTPAIVPPKKFRQCPEPASKAEKLGLKKGPRKAFELSQRSLAFIDQLRHHGQTAGDVDTGKKTRQISQPPSVRSKLLKSQDFQLQRQLRSKSQRNRQGLADECRATAGAGPRAVPSTAMSVSESGRSGSSKGGAEVITHSNGKQLPKRVSFEQEPKKGNYDPQVTGSPCVLNQRSSVVSNGRTPTNEITPSTSEDLSGGGHPTIHLEVAALQNGEPEPCGDMEEDDNVFLTQRDPEDMDLCSQMQNEDDKLIEVAHEQGTVQVEDSLSRPQLGSLGGSKCKYKDCAGTVKSQGEYCSRHSDAKAADEDVFRKPALPLSAAKPLRPTTTKIFSSSTNSRIANLSRSLENTPAPAPATKNKTSGVQSILKVSPPACAVSQKPMAEVKSLCNVLHSPAPITSNRQGYKLQLGDSKPSSVFQVSILLSSQSILETFIKEVLKWKYEMFVNFDQCGPPAGLCQSISRRVPLRFQDCGDYIDVFFPLVLLNTFEAVAQEWISSPNKGKLHQLRVRKFPTVYKKYWEFVVYLDECELAKQFHPRENDLVVLVSERLNGENDMERNALQESQAYHCGYVHKFRRTSVMHNGKSECSLCIQSQENLPVKLNDLVKCIVISSLVTTQRKLKAMSLLSGRNQLARAILNPHPTDFSTKDLLTTSSERITAYLNSFNEDQRKAIETAYAMVKHSPSVAKICLIHGPPGTGKSKTIVGFLYRLLTENLRKGHSDENSNAKIKQNRVLVCAPSNAAIDELMKKIIVEFKERCKDKHNPQGNCGDINLVRLGAEKSISSEVLRFSLDSQVDHRMKKALPSHVQEMHKRKEYLDRQLDELSRQRALCRGRRFEIQKQELDEKIAQVSKERQELASKVKEVQGRPQKTQNTIILESHVICCTLSTSGGLLLECAFWGQGGVPFSCVIVDEAGQACEVETLTPLIHRCNKLILVGDPKQLPPTVISMKAQEYGYDQSMMARFYKLLEEDVEHNMSGRLPVVQLTMQYRMHPDICLFPSTYIYNKTLKTHRPTESCRCSSEWPFQPYLVFDVGDGSERRDNDSYINVQEIKLVMEIIKLIKERKKDVNFRNIGIITHYRAQKTMIQKELDKEFDGKGLAEVDTVDAFQGRQKDCVIVTCVRANSTQSGSQGSIGFLASLQRLNVTITRAKYSLFILGHLRTLMENQHWNHLIQDAQSRGAIIKTCDKNYKHDALKILKLRLALQRSVTYPPTTTPELPRSPGSLPGSRPDTDLARTFLTSSRCHAPSDSTEATITVAARDPERPLVIDQLRDPRLLRRLGVSLEATTRSLGDPQLSSPQDPGTTSSSGESGFSGSPQGLGSLMELSPATGSSHRPPGPCEPPAVSTDASTDPRQCDQEGEHRHQRDTKARSEGEGERWSKPRKRNSGRDSRDPDKEDSSSSKKRKLL